MLKKHQIVSVMTSAALVFCLTSCGNKSVEPIPTEAPLAQSVRETENPQSSDMVSDTANTTINDGTNVNANTDTEFETLKNDFDSDVKKVEKLIGNASNAVSADGLSSLVKELSEIHSSMSATLDSMERIEDAAPDSQEDKYEAVTDAADDIEDIIEDALETANQSSGQEINTSAFLSALNEFNTANAKWNQVIK